MLAAAKMKLEKVPCVQFSHLTDAQKRAYVIADNRLAMSAGWDEELLANELSDLFADDFELDLLGFDADELEKMLDLDTSENEVAEDEVPEPPADPVTQPGDLWLLGDHRLLCGDCRNPKDMAKLIGKRKINVAITSPPYASQRTYDEESGFKPIAPDDFVDWFEGVQSQVAEHLASDGSWFINIKEHCEDGQRVLYVKDLTLAHVREWGWRFVDEYVWTHGGTPKAVKQRFKNGWEPIFHFAKSRHKFRPDSVMHKSGDIPDWSGLHPNAEEIQKHGKTKGMALKGVNARAKQKGSNAKLQGSPEGGKAIHDAVAAATNGMAYPSNVLSLGKNREALGHSAAYPTSLPDFFIRAYSDESDSIFDPFLGSGTTLIAAEQLNRKCYGMEISPQYCDVIIQRWEKLTGDKARKAD